MSRISLTLTGLVGLIGAVLLTAFCMYVMDQGWIPVLITNSTVVLGVFLFLAFFSVAEIPVMIFGMRRILDRPNPKAKILVWITNGGYTFFAAVYAAPFILLTGSLLAGAALAALSLVRLISAVTFVPLRK